MSASPHPFVAPHPADEGARFWFWDPSHFPGPVTPAAEHFDLPAMAAGFLDAARELRRPLAGQNVRIERGFVYFGIDLPRSQRELKAREAAYRETIDPLVAGALSDWQTRLEPRAAAINDELRLLASLATAPAAVPEILQRARAMRAEQWHVHDRALVPAMEAVARFQTRYGERLGGVLAAQRLLQGFPNRATSAAEALESLAEEVRARPALAASILRRGGRMPRPGLTEGGWFRDALADFLSTYGGRAEGWDVGAPTWTEDPRPVLAAIRQRLTQDASQPGSARRRAAEERERAISDALACLPPRDRAEFVADLTAAQAYPVVSEDHNAIIDQQGMAALRGVLLAAGATLTAQGLLARASDIVWLTPEEIPAATLGSSWIARVPARRRDRHRRRGRLVPPRTLGAALPDWAKDNPTLSDFFGLGGEPGGAAAELRGAGASPGSAAGRACVVGGLDDIDRLQAGDILICPMTSPAWTPWLGVIGGAVVETGGVLSHTAVLAREYGVPCVTGVRDATQQIPHGAFVQVDGTNGVVTWH